MNDDKTTPTPTFISQPIPRPASGPDFTSGHAGTDIQEHPAAGEPNSPDSHFCVETQSTNAVGDQATEGHNRRDNQKDPALGPILADPVLGILADVVDDLESVRIANENRLRTLTDADEHGHGLTLHNPEVARLAELVSAIVRAEHQAILNLARSMRHHPLGIWAKPIAGVGDKQLARLLSVIGDPYWNDLHERPRTVSELWAFCGYHVLHTSGQRTGEIHMNTAAGVAPKRARGQKSNWNEDARKRCYLIATSCIKQAKSPYRKVYDDTRAKYADAIHAAPCVRCGPKNKPAPEGSPLSLAHQHARGLRAVSKAFLKDLWREAKHIHENAAEAATS